MKTFYLLLLSATIFVSCKKPTSSNERQEANDKKIAQDSKVADSSKTQSSAATELKLAELIIGKWQLQPEEGDSIQVEIRKDGSILEIYPDGDNRISYWKTDGAYFVTANTADFKDSAGKRIKYKILSRDKIRFDEDDDSPETAYLIRIK